MYYGQLENSQLRVIASYVRLNINSFEHCALLEDVRNKTNEYHF